ncbi:hypothetical protein REPUB_Repub20aG0117200 [Reevesia pubescens]
MSRIKQAVSEGRRIRCTTSTTDLGGYLCVIVRILIPHEFEYFNRYESVPHFIHTYETREFEIYKLDMHIKEWERIWSFGDRSLFLGNCSTFFILAAYYRGCRSNCIYFTDDYYGCARVFGCYRIGIYNCDNKEVDFLSEAYFSQGPKYSFSRPLWIKTSSQ